MKRYLYLALMVTFFIAVFNFLYYIAVFAVVYYQLIPLEYIITFTDIATNTSIFVLISVIAGIIGYPVGKKWWKIIYVDGVYHFGKRHHHSR